jgi:hypothetical protein
MANTWKVGGLSLVRQGMLMLCLGMSLCVLVRFLNGESGL